MNQTFPLSSLRERGNPLISAAVDRGILVQTSFNTMCAIEYMKSHNIPSHIIERVLLQPELRRKLQELAGF
ncbi:MAG: hypothetical protein K2P77_07765 [Burkholderiaceae bacterium]|nr:hypothetical protein [Burkholderiaceae bacterium]